MLKRDKQGIFRVLSLLAVFMIFSSGIMAKSIDSVYVYLFPGQGSDERIFEEIKLEPHYRIINVVYPVPEANTSLKDFALQIGKQVDTSRRYIFIGVSLGGMISSELAEMMKPEKVIIISSAKCRDELPLRYKFQKKIPVYKLVPKAMIKMGAQILQPIVEPDRKKNKDTFKSMLGKKDKLYLKRTVGMIINWEKKTYNNKIIHIHGTNDHTLPYRKVKANYKVNKGSHMMTLTKGQEINLLINKILQNEI